MFWWSLGLLGVDALVTVAYPTIRDNRELDRTFAGLPASVQAMLALHAGSTLTSPVGYLDSQFIANVLPIMLLVFGIGVAAWAIAGDEAHLGRLKVLEAQVGLGACSVTARSRCQRQDRSRPSALAW